LSEPADVRDLLANERTLLAWVRTGLALIAFGFVIDRTALWFRFEKPADESQALLLGGAMILAGVACTLIGAVRFRACRQALLAGRPSRPGATGPIALALLVMLLALAMLVYLMGLGSDIAPPG
jgi:putative membrane protein